jgi:ketopantoate reductase
VGQVFGHHLALGGAEVSYFVRAKYRAEVGRGFALARLRTALKPRRETFAPHAVLSELDELRGQRFDQVWLTMSSAAVRGAWLRPFLTALDPDATLVSLQPDRSDHALLADTLQKPQQLVRGNIGFVAFAAPLTEQLKLDVDTAYWFPPLGASSFSGARERVAALRGPLARGGLPAGTQRDVVAAMAYPNAIGMTYLTALEAAGWSLDVLQSGELLGLCERAVREVLSVVRAETGQRGLGFGLLAHGWLAALAFRLASRVVPFPLLDFVQQHFTKVSAQTQLIIARLLGEAERRGLAHSALSALSGRRNASSLGS